MGKLVQLEVNSEFLPAVCASGPVTNSSRADFKSYRGHHVLQFGDSYFTSIIGPNGSGKSNSYGSFQTVSRCLC